MTLERVLTTAKDDAAALRRRGDARTAQVLDDLCGAVAEAAADWLAWLSESEATLRSGKSVDYFRDRRIQWEIDGLAKKEGRRWFYRRCIVPRSRLSSVQRKEALERVG